MGKKRLLRGTLADAALLTMVKLVTVALRFVVTRLLSRYLPARDYGTYSQVLLIVSTVASVTILGMVDGVNFFYCREPDQEKREQYVATLFALQCIIGGVAGTIIIVLRQVICDGFNNPDVGNLLLFAAVMPMMQNLFAMLQVLLVAVGKARMLAWRNLVISLIKLAMVIVVVSLVKNVAVVLATSVAIEIAQLVLFGWFLRKNHCSIRLRKIRFRLTGQILVYCVPMAVFILLNSLNRDCDKYLISLWTNPQTLAVYSNASKPLPFDLLIVSFTTVLIPKLTRLISAREYERATALYRAFLELSYVSTGILCCTALVAAPQLMQLLYSKKYLSGLGIFVVYILVDLIRFTNITIILSVAGKTKKLMFLAAGTLIGNVVLNVVLFRLMGVVGPAVATLITTLVTGALILGFSARELHTGLGGFFDWKYLLIFALESLIAVLLLYQAQAWLARLGVHYLLTLVAVAGVYGALMLLLHGKRLLRTLKTINRISKEKDSGA